MKLFRCVVACWLAFGTFAQLRSPAADWAPAQGPLATRWTKDVRPDNVLSEYPRPQMVRKDWANLNGLWQYAVRPKIGATPDQWDGQILVPFPIESALSGVMKHVDHLTYRRTFDVPRGWTGRRILLHFGAVDWAAGVYVNGKHLGDHKGGYDGFSFDITKALRSSGAQQIVVSVEDPTDAGTQPRGKQVRRPGSICPVSPWRAPASSGSCGVLSAPTSSAGAC